MSDTTPEPGHPADRDRIIRIPRVPDSEIEPTEPPAPAPPPPAPVVEVRHPPQLPAVAAESFRIARDAEL